jgi:uncharacterized membrane-anchored protein
LGNSGDEVIATGFDDSTIDKTVNGITYDVYTHSDANTSLLTLLLMAMVGGFASSVVTPF